MQDDWGIADGYEDVDGAWHDTPEHARVLFRELMGTPVAGDPMWFVLEGSRPHLERRSRLVLEDSTDLGEIDHLPPGLPCGYHRMEPLDDGADARVTTLVVHPESCPPAPNGWGVAAQVYSLWRPDGWGIGDFGDVGDLVEQVASRGGSAVLLSPLHAPAPTFPQQDSPYYPSSRRWLNPLLIPLDGTPPTPVDNSPGGMIDRDRSWRAKRAALEAQFAEVQRGGAQHEWRSWAVAQGSDLAEFCSFNALADELGPNWRLWPADLRHPHSPTIADRPAADPAFAERLDFHAWCQWTARNALTRAAGSGECRLIGDLAVGCSPDGADAWLHQDLMTLGARIGAPGDMLNTAGQDWGLPPFIPWRLRAAQYRPFIGMVRAAFEGMGGLRIDHVMGLFRQFWIPDGGSAPDGAYVHLDSEELLAIIALEAHRANAFVVGEDLGTVQPEVHTALAAAGMLGTKVWWFDTDVADWPARNLGTVTTHDLPTVAGVWADTDGTPEMHEALIALAPAGADAAAAAVAAHDEIGRSTAQLVMATVEDLAGTTERPNHPGTDEHENPNWRRRLAADVAGILDGSPGREIIAALGSERRRS